MHANDVTPELLRRLAGTHAQRGRVLSLYLNLDPHEHDTPRARSSAVGSLLNEARERVEAYVDALAEVDSFDDDTHGRHDQGGWSQARWERAVEEDVAVHLDRVAEALAVGARRRRYDRLLLAFDHEELRGEDGIGAILRFDR